MQGGWLGVRFHLGPTSPDRRRNSPIDRYLFADRLERRRLLVLVLLVILLLLVTLVAYRKDDHPRARLVVLRSGVWRAVDAQHRPLLGSQPVSVGEIIRTDRAGLAQVDYFDGSVTHVDSQTTFKLIDLLDRPDRTTIAGKLDGGRIWNRVSAMERTQDRFEVRIPHAWVSARGTSNIIDCRKTPECTVIGISDTTEVAIDGGDIVHLGSGDCTTIGGGERRECAVPRDELCSDEFTVAAFAAEGRTPGCLEAGPTVPPPAPQAPTVVPAPTPSAPAATVTPAPTPVSSAETSPAPLTADVGPEESEEPQE